MSWVAGVDGCRAGWVVVLLQRKGKKHETQVRLCRTFAEVLALEPQPEVIAIDIPIGLLDKPEPGGRECDRQARKLLGRRASSIFSPPTRPMLKATSYEQVRQLGLSIQAFNILPKIREVDQLMTPMLQMRIHEAAPELGFMSLAGVPMQYNKKTREGREERSQALQRVIGPILPSAQQRTKEVRDLLYTHGNRSLLPPGEGQDEGNKDNRTTPQQFPRSHVAPDDILDAYVLAWTALRIRRGEENRLPPEPSTDAKGLRMEILS